MATPEKDQIHRKVKTVVVIDKKSSIPSTKHGRKHDAQIGPKNVYFVPYRGVTLVPFKAERDVVLLDTVFYVLYGDELKYPYSTAVSGAGGSRQKPR